MAYKLKIASNQKTAKRVELHRAEIMILIILLKTPNSKRQTATPTWPPPGPL